MQSIQVFLCVIATSAPEIFTEKVRTQLEKAAGITNLQIVGSGTSNEFSISLEYDLEQISLDTIQEILAATDAKISELNVHIPSMITGVSDPYGASGVSITFEENLKEINGVLGVGMSANGILKILLDNELEEKQKVVNQILQMVKLISG